MFMNYAPRSPLVPIYIQLRYYAQTLNNKRNPKALINEVQLLINQLGVPGEQYFLIQVLEQFEITKEKGQSTPKSVFLYSWIQHIVTKSHFVDYFSAVIEAVCQQNAGDYIVELSNCLKLPLTTQLIMFLSLTYSPVLSFSQQGIKMLKKKLHDFQQQNKNGQFPPNIIHGFLYQLRNNSDNLELEQEVKFLYEQMQFQNKNADLKPLFEDKRGSVKWIDSMPTAIELPKDLIKASDIIQESGSLNLKDLKDLLNDIPFTEEDLIEIILYIAANQNVTEDQTQRDINQLFLKTQVSDQWEPDKENEKKIQTQWDIDVIIQYAQDRLPQIKWARVMEKLDRPDFHEYIKDVKSWTYLMTILGRIKKITQQQALPKSILLDKWENRKSQISFLTNLLKVGKPEIVFWNELAPKKWVQIDYLKIASLTGAMQFWSNLDFFQLMIEISDGYVAEIRELFEQPIKAQPDLVLISLSQIQPQSGGPLIDELFTTLFPLYVSSHANSAQVLEILWKCNQNLVISGMSELYRKELGKKDNSCLNLSRVLDITQGISQNQQQTASLLAMAECSDYYFSVPLGILAGKREFLNFDKWLQGRIKVGGQQFVNILLQYIDDNVIAQIKETQTKQGLPQGQLGQMNMKILDDILEKSQLKLEMITIIIEQLMSHGDKLGNKIKQQVQYQYKELVQVFPSLAGSPNPKQNQEVERLTDSFFSQYYNDQLTLEGFLQLLSQWKTTGSFQDKEVFACIITNLYNEYQYHSKYPLKELQLTGQLFGGVIDRGLIEGKSLDIALQVINFSLGHTNIRYEFGVKALDMIKNRIHEWPIFADGILKLENLANKSPELFQEIQKICEKNGIAIPVINIPPPQQEQPVVVQVTQVQQPVIIKQPVQVVQEVKQVQQVQQVKPVQVVQQQQSITPAPPHQKIQQIVVASTPQPKKSETPNNITMPFRDVLLLEFEPFDKQYQEEQVKEKITFILNNISIQLVDQYANELDQKIEKNETYKWFVKNFSYIRVPKTPQIQKEREVHILFTLLTKIKKPKLFYDITKDVQIALSIILRFQKNTPTTDDRNTIKWMGSFLGQLTLYRDKPILNKYFDYRALLDQTPLTVYALCKLLEWSASSNIFKTNNKWLNNVLKELDRRKENFQTMVKYELVNLIKLLNYEPEVVKQEPVPEPRKEMESEPIDPILSITHLPQFVQADPKLLNNTMDEKECKEKIGYALDKAISDIIPPVISRSVTIALITTRELVFKDFSQEPDEKLMLKGMHLIATNLSGSLAMVTCREPLKARIQVHLKEVLKDFKKCDDKFKESFITAASNDNLDLGCALIKKAVIERALEDVNNDPLIIQELEKRQRAKEKGQLYRDEQQAVLLSFLPEALQPRPQGLVDEEIRIYEEFGNKKVQQPKSQLQRVQQLCQLFQDPAQNDQKICMIVNEINESQESTSDQFYHELGEKLINHMLLHSLTAEKIDIIFQLIHPLIFKVTQKTNTKWSDLLILFLNSQVLKLDTSPLWWQAFPIMLKKNYIQSQDLDKILTQIVTKDNQIIVQGTISILKQIIKIEEQAQIQQFKGTMRELTKLKDKYQSIVQFTKDMSEYLTNTRQQQQQTNQPKFNQRKLTLIEQNFFNIDQQLLSQVQNILLRWFKSDKDHVSILSDISNILKSDQQMLKFFIYIIELCLNQVQKDKDVMDHSFVESLAKLIIVMLRTSQEMLIIMEKFLEACFIVLNKQHESHKQFNQRSIHKLLFNILHDIQEPLFRPEELANLLIKFAGFLEKTEPNLYPGFSYAWLELLANRYFFRLIIYNDQRYATLIVKLLEFLREIITEEQIKNKWVFEYMRGAYRLFVVFLQDFPDTMRKFSQMFADEIPFYHVQLLNMCLAPCPDNIQDPITCSNIYEIENCNVIHQIQHASLEELNFQKIKDEIQIMHQSSDDEIKLKYLTKFEIPDQKTKLPLSISGFFVVLPRTDYQRNDNNKLLQRMIKLASYAQRFTIFNVILNQIRFPEKITEFYIKFILHLFVQGDTAQIQEQLTTIINQRLIVDHPKTWGMVFLHEELLRTDSVNNCYKRFSVQRHDQMN